MYKQVKKMNANMSYSLDSLDENGRKVMQQSSMDTVIKHIYASCDTENSNKVCASKLIDFIAPHLAQNVDELMDLKLSLDPDGANVSVDSETFVSVISQWTAKFNSEMSNSLENSFCSTVSSKNFENIGKNTSFIQSTPRPSLDRKHAKNVKPLELNFDLSSTSLQEDANVSTDMTILLDKIRELEHCNKKITEELSRTRDLLASTDEQIEQMDKFQNEVQNLKRQLSNSEQINSQLQCLIKDKDDAVERISHADNEVNKLQKHIMSLTKDNSGLSCTISTLQNEYKELDKKCQGLRSKVIEIEEEGHHLLTENSIQRKEIDLLQQSNMHLKSNFTEKEEEVRHLNTVVERIRVENQQLNKLLKASKDLFLHSSNPSSVTSPGSYLFQSKYSVDTKSHLLPKKSLPSPLKKNYKNLHLSPEHSSEEKIDSASRTPISTAVVSQNLPDRSTFSTERSYSPKLRRPHWYNSVYDGVNPGLNRIIGRGQVDFNANSDSNQKLPDLPPILDRTPPEYRSVKSANSSFLDDSSDDISLWKEQLSSFSHLRLPHDSLQCELEKAIYKAEKEDSFINGHQEEVVLELNMINKKDMIIDDLKSDIVEKEKVIIELRNSIDEKDKVIGVLRSDIDEKEETLVAIRNTIDNNDSHQRVIEELRNNIIESDTIVDSLKDYIMKKETINQGLLREIEEKERTIQEITSSNVCNTKQITELHICLSGYNSKITEVFDQINELNTEVQSLSDRSHKLEEALLQKEEIFEQELDQLQYLLDQQVQKYETRDFEFHELEIEMSAKVIEIIDMKVCFEHKEQAFQKNNKQLIEEIEILKMELNVLSGQVAYKETKLTQLDCDLKSYREAEHKRMQAKQNQEEPLLREIQDLKNANYNLKESLSKQNNENNALLVELSTLRKLYKTKSEETRFCEVCEALDTENKKFIAQICSLEKKNSKKHYDKLHLWKEKLLKKCEDLEEQVKSEKLKNDRFETENNNLKSKYKSEIKKCEDALLDEIQEKSLNAKTISMLEKEKKEWQKKCEEIERNNAELLETAKLVAREVEQEREMVMINNSELEQPRIDDQLKNNDLSDFDMGCGDPPSNCYIEQLKEMEKSLKRTVSVLLSCWKTEMDALEDVPTLSKLFSADATEVPSAIHLITLSINILDLFCRLKKVPIPQLPSYIEIGVQTLSPTKWFRSDSPDSLFDIPDIVCASSTEDNEVDVAEVISNYEYITAPNISSSYDDFSDLSETEIAERVENILFTSLVNAEPLNNMCRQKQDSQIEVEQELHGEIRKLLIIFKNLQQLCREVAVRDPSGDCLHQLHSIVRLSSHLVQLSAQCATLQEEQRSAFSINLLAKHMSKVNEQLVTSNPSPFSYDRPTNKKINEPQSLNSGNSLTEFVDNIEPYPAKRPINTVCKVSKPIPGCAVCFWAFAKGMLSSVYKIFGAFAIMLVFLFVYVVYLNYDDLKFLPWEHLFGQHVTLRYNGPHPV